VRGKVKLFIMRGIVRDYVIDEPMFLPSPRENLH